MFDVIRIETEKYEKIGAREYKLLCEQFGEENIKAFFDNLIFLSSEEEIEKLMEKYSYCFESVDNSENKSKGTDIEEFDELYRHQILTPEQEKYYGNIIKNYDLKKSLEICKDSRYDTKELNYSLLLNSIKTDFDVKLITKLIKKNVLSEKEKLVLKKYLELYEKEGVLSVESLKSNFKEIDFKDERLDAKELEKRVYQLIQVRIAKEQLISSNYKLVASIAHKFTGRGIDFEDLFQEGCFGLIKAVEKFDPDKGRFSTYATWWILQGIRKLIATMEKPFSIAQKGKADAFKILEKFKELAAEIGREPSDSEVSKRYKIPMAQIVQARHVLEPTISLDATIEGTDLSIMDSLKDESADIEDQLSKKFLKEIIAKIIEEKFSTSQLDPNNPADARIIKKLSEQRLVLIQYFGLDGNPSKTIEKIARDEQIGRTKTVAILRMAERRIQCSPEFRKLKL